MFLRFCFAILALASICFTCYYLHENRVNNRISLVIHNIWDISVYSSRTSSLGWLELP